MIGGEYFMFNSIIVSTNIGSLPCGCWDFLADALQRKKADLVKRSTFFTQRIKLSKDEIRGRKELEEETN